MGTSPVTPPAVYRTPRKLQKGPGNRLAQKKHSASAEAFSGACDLRLSSPTQELFSALSQGPSDPGHLYPAVSSRRGPLISLALPGLPYPQPQLSDLPFRLPFSLAAFSLYPSPHVSITTCKPRRMKGPRGQRFPRARMGLGLCFID